MLKALKKIFSKGEAEQPASITPTPSAPSQPSAPRHSQPKAETPREAKKPRTVWAGIGDNGKKAA